MGRNEVAEEQESVLKKIAKHFWAPVPWMLEGTVVFGSSSANTSKPPLSPPLLLFSVALGTFQEGRANAALSCANAAIMWKTRPSPVLMLFSLADIVIVAAIAIFGLLSRRCLRAWCSSCSRQLASLPFFSTR
jgi:hypothetical protein